MKFGEWELDMKGGKNEAKFVAKSVKKLAKSARKLAKVAKNCEIFAGIFRHRPIFAAICTNMPSAKEKGAVNYCNLFNNNDL